MAAQTTEPMAPHNLVFLLCFQHVLDTICMTCTPVELFEFLLSVLRPAPHALYHSHLTSNQHLQLAALGLHYNTHSKEPPPTPRRQLIPRQHAAVGNVAIPSNKDTGIIAMTHSFTAHSVPPSSRHHGRDWCLYEAMVMKCCIARSSRMGKQEEPLRRNPRRAG